MRNLPAPIQSMLNSGVGTLAWCARLTRTDGVQLGFTEHDEPISVSGVLCEPQTGINLTALSSSAAGAVDNADIMAFLDSEVILEEELLHGVYDNAGLVISLVDWTNAGAAEIVLAAGTLGEISTGDTQFRAEFRSLAQHLQQTIGRKVAAECDVQHFGDARCQYSVPSHGGQVTDPRPVNSQPDLIEVDTFGAGGGDKWYFVDGVLTWTSGPNTAFAHQVLEWKEDLDRLRLDAPPAHPIDVGHDFLISPGCDRTATTCKDKWSNFVNFQGFPHVPGRDSAAERPGSK